MFRELPSANMPKFREVFGRHSLVRACATVRYTVSADLDADLGFGAQGYKASAASGLVPRVFRVRLLKELQRRFVSDIPHESEGVLKPEL